MILCDDYKLAFVQLPHTGSTGIGKVLVEQYGGRSVLCKHSYLDELKQFYPEAYGSYFIFGGVRNPLDERVSSYFKLKSNHLNLYSGVQSDAKARDSGRLAKSFHSKIVENNYSFSEYFLQLVKFVYFNPISIHERRYDFVYRYENLDHDFGSVLRHVGARPTSLPKNNKTAMRTADFEKYYTKIAQEHAHTLFSPFMDHWGYQFPEDWFESQRASLMYKSFSFAVRRLQWKIRAIQNSKQYVAIDN